MFSIFLHYTSFLAYLPQNPKKWTIEYGILPPRNNFTLALLVMQVTIIMSAPDMIVKYLCSYVRNV